jgi:ATP-dependent Clp protease ATP-binding subunit ClpA
MIEQDTVRLLRECDAGIRMGVDSIGDVLKHVKSEDLRRILTTCKVEHEKLKEELDRLLHKYQDEGKDPNPIAKGMSWMKTNAKLMMEESDATVACLMTDGCNMGIKSLSKYLNQYKAADETSKNLTKELIRLEDQLVKDIRIYL